MYRSFWFVLYKKKSNTLGAVIGMKKQVFVCTLHFQRVWRKKLLLMELITLDERMINFFIKTKPTINWEYFSVTK